MRRRKDPREGRENSLEMGSQFKKRSRVLCIRLSDEELRGLRRACLATGAVSISDLARKALRLLLEDLRKGSEENQGSRKKIQELEFRLMELQASVRQLTSALEDGR